MAFWCDFQEYPMHVIFICGFESHIQIATFQEPMNVVTSTRPGTSDGCGLGGWKKKTRNLEHRFVCGMILSMQNELCTASKCKHYANISSRVLYIKRKNSPCCRKVSYLRSFCCTLSNTRYQREKVECARLHSGLTTLQAPIRKEFFWAMWALIIWDESWKNKSK